MGHLGVHLAPSPRPEADWARDYLAAIADIAARFGLDRLERDPRTGHGKFRPTKGEVLIHSWCSSRARRWIEDGVLNSTDWFLSVASYGGGLPDIGEVVRREEFLSHEPDGIPFVIVDERREPLIHVRIEDEWDPTGEVRKQAKRRLLAEATRQIDAELDRVTADARAQGYEFEDTDLSRRDLLWLYWKVRHRLTYGQIAQRWRREQRQSLLRGRKHRLHEWAAPEKDAELVKKAVVRMAESVGIDRRGW